MQINSTTATLFNSDFIEPVTIVWYNEAMTRINKLKNQATKLRDRGYSYNMISASIGISKSTLSDWFRDRKFTPNIEVLDRIYRGPMKSAEKSHNRKVQETKELLEAGAKEIGKLSNRDLWLLGLGIYIGEGTKNNDIIRVINADPAVIRLSIRWFKEIIGLPDDNFAIRLHLYPDNNINESIKFWKKETGLSDKNFQKVQIDRRENKKIYKRKKLPFGTAHVTIKANGNIAFGVKLFRRIKGWIYGVLSQ
ncbi:MAG: helix-turn-helix transcriptional regulator [Candidatus Yanofskybacteria bacterium]|nr:helix-turn-helix transcriptional regulator [Candidatus Yanofskybacteria bacterium]